MEDFNTMNIGLIAMSGIRVCDTELLELGLTLPGFVERSKTIASLPSLGLLTLAGMTPRKHRVEYYEVPELDSLDRLPDNFDLVGISSYSAQIDEAYALAQKYREMGIPSVLGGPHVSVLPDEAGRFSDSVVIGEGESVWSALLEDAGKGKLQSRYGSLETEFDLEDAPMPAFKLLDISKYNRLTVQTSRGCPHQCEFCASSVVLARKYKQKPINKVLAEIDRIFSIWDHPFLEFADDNSFVNHAYWRELLPQLKGKHLKWFAETDLSVARDETLLSLMRETGCAQVLIGLESPVKEALEGIELHNNWKRNQFSHYRDAIATIQSHGITVNGCFVIGLDGHTPDIFEQVFEFVKETGLYEVQITLMTPFPGTPLYERLRAEERLIEPTNWKKCTLFDINFIPANMTLDELHSGFKDLGVKIYSEEFTNWRRRNFFRQKMHQKGG
jgi:radical SAM superfamily enzyme YgiQ (UPF0313 family)